MLSTINALSLSLVLRRFESNGMNLMGKFEADEEA
jgi:hypothetical protein